MDLVVRAVLSAASSAPGPPSLEALRVEGCPTLTHQALRAAADASVEARRPLLAALKTLSLARSAGGRMPFVVGAAGRKRFGKSSFAVLLSRGVAPSWPLFLLTLSPAMPPSLCHAPPGARGVFVVPLARLQYAAPNLEVLDLTGLCSIFGWSCPLPADPTLRALLHAEEPGLPGLQPAAPGLPSTGGGGDAPGWPALRVCRLAASMVEGQRTAAVASTLGDACLQRFIGASPALEELDLGGALRLTPDALAALGPFPALRRASLAGSGACTDAGAAALLALTR